MWFSSNFSLKIVGTLIALLLSNPLEGPIRVLIGMLEVIIDPVSLTPLTYGVSPFLDSAFLKKPNDS